MANPPVPLSFKKQVELFEEREMIVTNKVKAEKYIQDIGYYKIKEFAFPLSIVREKQRIYPDVRFEDVITRYYSDKDLRIALLHSIEDIEVSVKTKLAYVLGKNGAYYYLNFSNWCNKDEYCKYYLQDKQSDFKKRIRKKIALSDSHELSDNSNLNKDGFPSIWLVIDVLTFGDIIYLLSLMSNKNLKKIADFYDCSPNELISWLKCLKFIRNSCAHNSMIINTKLKTTPLVKKEWEELLFRYPHKQQKVTDRLAVVLCVLKHLAEKVNPSYNYNKIYASLNSIIQDNRYLAQNLGFKDPESLSILFPKKAPKKYYKK